MKKSFLIHEIHFVFRPILFSALIPVKSTGYHNIFWWKNLMRPRDEMYGSLRAFFHTICQKHLRGSEHTSNEPLQNILEARCIFPSLDTFTAKWGVHSYFYLRNWPNAEWCGRRLYGWTNLMRLSASVLGHKMTRIQRQGNPHPISFGILVQPIKVSNEMRVMSIGCRPPIECPGLASDRLAKVF